MKLNKKIKDRTAKVGVIGLGYVGLPLAIEFVRAGFNVFGIDIDENKINLIKQGKNYIKDVNDETLQKAVNENKLIAVSDFSIVKNMDDDAQVIEQIDKLLNIESIGGSSLFGGFPAVGTTGKTLMGKNYSTELKKLDDIITKQTKGETITSTEYPFYDEKVFNIVNNRHLGGRHREIEARSG